MKIIVMVGQIYEKTSYPSMTVGFDTVCKCVNTKYSDSQPFLLAYSCPKNIP